MRTDLPKSRLLINFLTIFLLFIKIFLKLLPFPSFQCALDYMWSSTVLQFLQHGIPLAEVLKFLWISMELNDISLWPSQVFKEKKCPGPLHSVLGPCWKLPVGSCGSVWETEGKGGYALSCEGAGAYLWVAMHPSGFLEAGFGAD